MNVQELRDELANYKPDATVGLAIGDDSSLLATGDMDALTTAEADDGTEFLVLVAFSGEKGNE